MSKKIKNLLVVFLMFLGACQQGFERFAPPANSISGRGAKQNPRIVSTTPANGGTVSPVTDANGTQIRVLFDMTMRVDTNPVINTYVRDDATSGGWIGVANSGYTWTWSSTNFANDTLTINLGWVRWPENNVVAFDFNNDTLQNLDDMPLANDGKLSFTVSWNPGRYKVVPTGQETCYYWSSGFWRENNCAEGGVSDPKIGTYDYPAGQNGFIEPMNGNHGTTLYGPLLSGESGRRFPGAQPLNLLPANCASSVGPNTNCHPYTIDSVTTLTWKTCSEGQYYYTAGDLCETSGTDFTWGDAINACAHLNTLNNGQGYGGRKNWRLPTIYELESLVDYGARVFQIETTVGEPAIQFPAIHGYQRQSGTKLGPFPNTPTSRAFWSSSGVTALINGQFRRGGAYTAEFQKGTVGIVTSDLLNNSRATSNRQKVRCVSGPAVEPAAPNLTASVIGDGTQLTQNAASFVGFDNNASFNVISAKANYDIQTEEHSVTLQYNKQPRSDQAGLVANYCIGLSTATSCAASSPTILSAVSTGNNYYKLTLGSAMSPNAAYKLFVNNVQSASDQWQTATNYNASTYVIDSGTVYRVVNTHMSTSIGTDVANGDLVALSQFTPSTPYAQNTEIYAASLGAVVKVQTSGYTSSSSAQTDITQGNLQIVRNMISAPQANLNLNIALFSGPAQVGRASAGTAPAPTTVFNVNSASSAAVTMVQLTFNRLPKVSEATNPANYCIIGANPAAWNCTSTLTPVTAASLSGYTVTLTANLTAGVPYAVLVNNNVTYLGSHVVDDTVNKLRWQRCRRGLLDTPTCGDDGITTNDSVYWNDGMNYCDQLNYEHYDDHTLTHPLNDRYRWRAPTINELKTILDRSLFGTTGVSINTTLFPTPAPAAENYLSSTNYSLSGGGTGTPHYNRAWTLSLFAGSSSEINRDWSSNTSTQTKPYPGNIRCVRSLP